jgi:transposase
MEDVLDLYAEVAAAPPDPECPLVCFDERPVVLHEDAHPGQPCAPGRRAREDYEYVRRGTCVCLLSFAPAEGWRHVEVSEHRAAGDFAHAMRRLCDETYPEAVRVRVVLDNLSTHSAAALYQTFAPAEARRLAKKLEFHYTPKHASWLNMAEIELAVLSRQCLARRIGSRERVAEEVAAWQAVRNQARARVHWRFTTQDARVKLVRLYPNYA